MLRRYHLLPLRDVLLNALPHLTPAHSLHSSFHDHDFCNTAFSIDMYRDESVDVEIGWHITFDTTDKRTSVRGSRQLVRFGPGINIHDK